MRIQSSLLILSLAALTAVHAVATTLPDSCGSDKVKFDVSLHNSNAAIAPSESDKAQVVFIESVGSLTGCPWCGATARIGIDGQWVGANRNNSYSVVSIAPGSHNFCTSWQAVNSYLKTKVAMASLNAEPGKTYFYKVNVLVDGNAFDLVPITDVEAKYRLQKAKLSVATASK